MELRLALFTILLAIVAASVVNAELSESEENTQHRIKSISGLPREEAEKLVERVWQELLNKGEYESASLMVADVDGDGQEEAIVALSISRRGEGIVAIFRKKGEDYALWDKISCDGSPKVKTVDVLGNGKQALIIQSLTGGAKWGRWSVRVHQRGKGEFAEIWKGVTVEDGVSLNGRYNTNAEVQFIDLNGDGVREIVRIGVVSKSEYEEQPGLEEAQLPEIESETEVFSDRDIFSRATLGYEAVCKFRETFFHDKEFNYYIQYKARVTQDTKTKEANILERIPIAAGTRVGVLSVFSAAYSHFLSLDTPIFVILPDSRVVPLDSGALERIYQ
jgi:hypothetical protein